MSATRQSRPNAWPHPEAAIIARSLALRLPPDHRLEPHRHAWAQVVYATEGVMTVHTEDGTWVVPPQRAAWVPGGMEHEVETTGRVRMRTVYLRGDRTTGLPEHGAVLAVTPLLRELILETIRRGMLREDVPEEARLVDVLVDQLRELPAAPLQLAWPRDPRARVVAERVTADLAAAAPLTILAEGSGASVRTLERLFRRETDMTFHGWRQQARLMEAMRRLAAGESVTTTALAVGFQGASAFIAMFQRLLGSTPGAYFRRDSGS